MITCPYCGTLNRVADDTPANAYCGQCDGMLWRSRRLGIRWTMAFSLAALILYIPANVFPILSMTRLGQYSENTIISGVSELYASGMWGVATIVFLASVAVPLLKLMGLFYLCWRTRHPGDNLYAARIYRIIHTIGPWSMLDVFIVAILVSLVKLGDLANVVPGPGLVAFTAVVVLTTLATQLFDPRYVWRHTPGHDPIGSQI